MSYIFLGIFLVGLYLGQDTRNVGRSALGWGLVSLVLYYLAIVNFLTNSPFVGFLDLSCGVFDTILMAYRLRDYNVKKSKEENKHKTKREQFLEEIMNIRK